MLKSSLQVFLIPFSKCGFVFSVDDFATGVDLGFRLRVGMLYHPADVINFNGNFAFAANSSFHSCFKLLLILDFLEPFCILVECAAIG